MWTEGFILDDLIGLEEKENGDLIESILDLHLVYDAGNGEVRDRFNQKWEFIKEQQQRQNSFEEG